MRRIQRRFEEEEEDLRMRERFLGLRNLGFELEDKAKENEVKVLALKLREYKSQHFDVSIAR